MKLDETTTAEKIGIAVKTMQNWRCHGEGPPYYKIGGRVLYDSAEVDDWLAGCRRLNTSDPGTAVSNASGRNTRKSAKAMRGLHPGISKKAATDQARKRCA